MDIPQFSDNDNGISIPKEFCDYLNRFDNVIFIISNYQLGTFIFINEACNHILGYSKEFFLQKGANSFFEISHPEDTALIQRHIAIFLNESRISHQDVFQSDVFELRLKKADGNYIYTQFDAYPLNYKNNKIEFFLGVLKDISIKKQAENFLLAGYLKLEKDEKKASEFIQEYKKMMDPTMGRISPEEMIEITFKTNPSQVLSEREKELLKLIARGNTSKEIAKQLNISEHTVETHRKNIMTKFNVKNMPELIKEVNRSYWLGN